MEEKEEEEKDDVEKGERYASGNVCNWTRPWHDERRRTPVTGRRLWGGGARTDPRDGPGTVVTWEEYASRTIVESRVTTSVLYGV